MKNLKKLVLTNLGIATADILCFSNLGLGLSFVSPNPLVKAGAITTLVMSAFVFVYSNISLLKGKPAPTLVVEPPVMTIRDYVSALRERSEKLPFAADDLGQAIGQAEEFYRKEEALHRIIAFNNGKSMRVLTETGDETEAYLGEILRQLVKRSLVLDPTDAGRYESAYRAGIRQLVDKGEETLDQFGVFLGEVSRMGDQVDLKHTGLLSSIEALQRLRGSGSPELNGNK